jgi:hypothetical protein
MFKGFSGRFNRLAENRLLQLCLITCEHYCDIFIFQKGS